jgi:nitroreductase
MKKFLELVKARRSIRSYKPDPVPREMIETCLEAVRHSPTACNRQSWRFIITQGDLRQQIIEETLGGIVVPNKWAVQAPVIVIIAVDMDLAVHRVGAGIKGIDYHLIDAGIAGEHFVLQAAELGLGTCWIGWFDKKKVKRILGLPKNWDVPSMITLGFPEDLPGEKSRRSVEEISEFRE